MEIVQNIGRALRLNRDGSTKIARIIVPVFLKAGEDPTDMIASASLKPLVAVLQGLRSHNERPVEQPASRAPSRDKHERKMHIQHDEDGRTAGTGGKGDGKDQDQDGTDAAAEPALLHFSSPRDAATIAAFLHTRVYRPENLAWLEGYQALLHWRAQNETTGLYAVPYDVEAEAGVTKAFPLGLSAKDTTPAHTPRPPRPNHSPGLSTNHQHTRPAAAPHTNKPPYEHQQEQICRSVT